MSTATTESPPATDDPPEDSHCSFPTPGPKPTPGPCPVEFVTDGWPPLFREWPPRWWRRLTGGRTRE